MAGSVKVGMILVKDGALLPESIKLETEPYSTNWRLVKNLDGYGLDRTVRGGGWTFFFLAGEVKASAFGFDREKATGKAINRLLTGLTSEQFNALEITQVASRYFLGLPYVTISAHSRHIQESMFLSPRPLAEWEGARLIVTRTVGVRTPAIPTPPR